MIHYHMALPAGDRSRELRAEADRPRLARRGSWGMSARGEIRRRDPLRPGLGPLHRHTPGGHSPAVQVRDSAGDAP
jgi:hypothetical protein